MILNLLVLVPMPRQAVQVSQAGVYGQVPSKKRANKFMLEVVFDFLGNRSSELPDNTGASLLEELNEVKELWHHEPVTCSVFQVYFTKNLHGSAADSLFHFWEDARYSPPPEYLA